MEKPKTLEIIAVSAKIQLVTNIMIIEPINKVILVTKVARLWFILWEMVSTSLVTRDKTSPVSWLSKYFNGKLFILILIK